MSPRLVAAVAFVALTTIFLVALRDETAPRRTAEHDTQPAPAQEPAPKVEPSPAPAQPPAKQGWWDWGKEKASGWWNSWGKK